MDEMTNRLKNKQAKGDRVNINEMEKVGGIRKKLGMTQTELAKLAGVSQSMIAKIESGRLDPAYSNARKIFEALEHEMNRKHETKKAREIMCSHIISLSTDDELGKAMKLMKENGISQLPVFEGDVSVGNVSEDMIMDWITKYGEKMREVRVGDAMKESFPILPEDADLESISGLLRFYKAVLVKKGRKITGIITKADLIKVMR